MDLSSLLRHHAAANPQKTALYCGERSISYRSLDESSTLLARWFLDQGLKPGERIAIHWWNSIEVVQLFFAAFRAGLIAVPVNTRLKPPEIGYILDHSQARICFSAPDLAPLLQQTNTGRGIHTELPALVQHREAAALPSVQASHAAVILYTSGTTARPKGVVHSHLSLYETARIGAREFPDLCGISLCVLPLMHAGALNLVLLPSIYAGASVALVPAADPGAVLDAVEKHGCTFLPSLPTLLQFILDEQERAPRRTASLRAGASSGDAVPVALQNRFQSSFGMPLQELYCMTESLPMILNPRSAMRPGSLGRAAYGVEVRLIDSSGREVPQGETGEIAVRSPANCIGYWNDPESTSAAMGDGWLRTGDLAFRDAEGYYWFQGRKKEVIIRAGSNISPQEVEEALYRHPAVRETGVVGIPDPVYGEIVAAFVVLREGKGASAEDLQNFARQVLADYKAPERIVFLQDLPKSPTGKVQRRALKERLLDSAVWASP